MARSVHALKTRGPCSGLARHRCGYLTLGASSTLDEHCDATTGKSFTFAVNQHPNSTLRLVLKARSDEERLEWCTAIQGIIDTLRRADPFRKPAAKMAAADAPQGPTPMSGGVTGKLGASAPDDEDKEPTRRHSLHGAACHTCL
jgi:hypothetical protein